MQFFNRTFVCWPGSGTPVQHFIVSGQCSDIVFQVEFQLSEDKVGNLIGVSDDLVDWQGTSVLSWLLTYVS